jgi:hypothetical protein
LFGLVVGALVILGVPYQTIGLTEPAQDQFKIVKPSEDDLLLLSVVLGPVQLTDELEGYRNGAGVLLPFGELCRLLEVAIKTDPIRGTAGGFLSRSDHIFSLDIRRRRITYLGKDLPFEADFIQVQKADIYVDARAINKWFALGIVFDGRASGILVNPKDPLPLQRRLQRESLALQLGSALHGGYRDPGFARVANPYENLGSPVIDQSFAFNEAIGLGQRVSAARYTAQIASDFAQGGVNGFLDVESNANPVARLSYGEMDPSGELLGPLHASQAVVGDLDSLDLPLVSASHPTTGLSVSNAPLSQQGGTESTCISGPLLPGWDVQLFQGDALVAFQSESGTGKYEFRNLPLTLGVNRFRLEFNGPLGEQHEETLTRNVVGTLAPGSLKYSMFLGGSADSPEWAAQSELGLRRDLTAFSSIASEPLANGNHQYGTVGMRGYLDGALLSARIVDDPLSGQASQIGSQWNWGRTSIKLNQTTVNGLVSAIYGSELNQEKSGTELQLGNFALPSWSHLLPTDIDITREETTLGTQEWQIQNRLSYQSHGLGITNIASWESDTGTADQRSGELMVTDWRNGNSWQGSLSYQIDNSFSVVSMAMQTSRVLHDLRVLNFGAYEAPQDGNIGLTATLSQSAGSYSYGVSMDVSRVRGIILGLNVSFGAIKDPSTGKWTTTAQSQATQGAVLVRFFQDRNGTGRLSAGNVPIAGITIFVNDSPYPKATGVDGTLLIQGLRAYQAADIRISETTLENPLLISKLLGLRINPRPGTIQTIDLAVVATAEVSGTISIQEDKGLRPATGVLVEVVDLSGKILQKQRTAYDGYFNLSRVPVGSHIVRVCVDGTTVSKRIVVPSEGAYLDGVDLTITSSAAN